MFFLRILLFLLALLLLRRVYLRLTRPRADRIRRPASPAGDAPKPARSADWTQQDISDADYEEIT